MTKSWFKTIQPPHVNFQIPSLQARGCHTYTLVQQQLMCLSQQSPNFCKVNNFLATIKKYTKIVTKSELRIISRLVKTSTTIAVQHSLKRDPWHWYPLHDGIYKIFVVHYCYLHTGIHGHCITLVHLLPYYFIHCYFMHYLIKINDISIKNIFAVKKDVSSNFNHNCNWKVWYLVRSRVTLV